MCQMSNRSRTPPNFDCYTDRITTACAPVESTRGSNKSRQVRRACLCMNQVRSSATAQRGTERGRVLQRGASADLRSSEAHSCPSVWYREFGYCIWSHLPPDPDLGSAHGARLCTVMNMWERPKETCTWSSCAPLQFWRTQLHNPWWRLCTLHDDPRAPIVATACHLVLVTCAPGCT